MDNKEIFLTVILTMGWIVAIVFEIQCTKWRNKHDEAVSAWTIETRRKDKQIEKLQNELETYKTWEDVVHVEKFVVDPLVFNIKIDIDRDVFDSMGSFKSFCLGQAARHIVKVLKENDNLYQLMYERNAMLCRDNVIIRVRLTPFKEDADWYRVPIRHYEPLVVLNPANDISVM